MQQLCYTALVSHNNLLLYNYYQSIAVSVVKGLKDCPNYSDTGPHAYLCVKIVTSKSGPGSGLSCARDGKLFIDGCISIVSALFVGTTIQIVTHAGNRVYSHCDSDIYSKQRIS